MSDFGPNQTPLSVNLVLFMPKSSIPVFKSVWKSIYVTLLRQTFINNVISVTSFLSNSEEGATEQGHNIEPILRRNNK